MKTLTAMKVLNEWSFRDRTVFTVSDLRKLFPDISAKTFSEGLRRLVSRGVLVNAARGIYVNPATAAPKTHLLEKIAVTLRRGEYSYLSLESALSEYGVISQIPMGQITVMTSGRSASIDTPYGGIAFTHTSRSVVDILNGTIASDRPLRIAKVDVALRDLKRTGRNLHLVSPAEYEDVLRETTS